MEKWIVYFFPKNKKLQICQYHTEANSMEEAIKKTIEAGKEKYNEEFKIAGVRNYPESFKDEWVKDVFF